MTTVERKLSVLMRDHGYRVEGKVIISNGIRGFTSDRIFRRCRSVFDAAEQLIPIVGRDDYSNRFRTITRPSD